MNLLAISFSLLASTCLTSASNEECVANPVLESIKEVESLKTIILKQHPEDILGYMVSVKGWDEDLAWAFSFGLALGRQWEMAAVQDMPNDMGFFELKVSKKNLMELFHNSKIVKEDQSTYNPFSELFDLKMLLQMVLDSEPTISLLECRILFSKCALKHNTMISVDLAILQWYVHVIKAKQQEKTDINAKPQDQVIDISPSIIMPICALSMHPQIKQYYISEIHLLLSQFEEWAFSDIPRNWSCYHFSTFSTLLTIIKVHDEDCKVRQKASEIAAQMYPKMSNSCWKSRMILGPNHVFVKSMEKSFLTPEKVEECIAKVSTQLLRYDRKVHTAKDDPFALIIKTTYMTAIIQGNTLKWEGLGASFRNKIWFNAQPGAEPKQVRLFICCRFPPPVSFWAMVMSWTNLKEFYKILKTTIMRRMILTYGMTILESSSLFGISEPAA